MRTVLIGALVMLFSVVSAGAQVPSSEPAAANVPLVVPEMASREGAAQAPAAAPQRKSMAATVLLWLIVPGGGNFYAGDTPKGLIELGGTVGGIAIMATSFREECEVIFRTTICTDEVSAGQMWAGLGTVAAFRIWGLITAINRVEGINSGRISTFQRFQIGLPTKKTPFKLTYTHSF